MYLLWGKQILPAKNVDGHLHIENWSIQHIHYSK